MPTVLIWSAAVITSLPLVSLTDKLYRRGSGYWILNASLLVIKEYINRIKLLIQSTLTGAIINNRWWCSLKRAVKFECVRYSIGLLGRESSGELDVVKSLEEAMRIGSASQVKVKGL